MAPSKPVHPPRRRPELLAPAGDRQCVRAAVENGADAVYFGLECGFNARARATNLHVDDLPEVMALLRGRGVKGYVTLNTLIFPGELDSVEQAIVKITEAGADAVLVQDLGLVRLIRAVSPDLSIHASTQMTLTSAECIRAVEQLGIQRVVLARELSIREIRKIHGQTNIELETFVHGALCVAYSGQCLTSESLGGRSANRGQCAQACRLPYDIICDDQDIDLDRVKYLLSPQDLAAYALVPDLIDAGVACLKIEGRLKSPEYVANITRHYRQAIDAAMADRPLGFTRRDETEMELSFSRGFSPGWLNGCDHKMLVPGLSSAKRGVLLGTVVSVQAGRVRVQLSGSVARGDGVVFAGDREHNQEQGGRVYEVFQRGRSLETTVADGDVELAFGRDAIAFARISPGQQVWKTDDPQLTARLRATFTGADALRRVPLHLAVHATVGAPLRVSGRAANGATCEVESAEPLAEAIKHPLTRDLLAKQLGRLGGSTYELGDLDDQIEGRPMVPLSVLGKIRATMLAQLDCHARNPKPRRICRSTASDLQAAAAPSDEGVAKTESATLHVLCRSLRQLDAVLDCGITDVIADFQDIREYRSAVQTARGRGVRILLATPRIQKPDEMGIFRVMLKHAADGWLVRNLAGMSFCAEQQVPFDCDFSLNASNQWTVRYLRERGARRVTASYDLNREQLLDLIAVVPPSCLQVVVHQHMPMFHMEHCVFCAVLSPGTNKTNCGRPCDDHQVRMRDRIGMEHTLKADVGCRNTLFNAVPQSAAEIVPLLVARGLRDFRIELPPDDDAKPHILLQLYRDLLDGKVSGKSVWQTLNASNRVGVTRGTLEERRNPLAIL